MLRQHLPTLRLTRIRFTRCHLRRLPHPLLMLPTLILPPMRLIHQLFLTRFVMRDQLILTIADQFLPPHLRHRFAQQRPVLGVVPAQKRFV